MAKSVKFKMVCVELQIIYQSEDKSLHIMTFPYFPQIEDIEHAKTQAFDTLKEGEKVVKVVKGKKNVCVHEIPLKVIFDNIDIAKYAVAE
jgi:hypothetical protein